MKFNIFTNLYKSLFDNMLDGLAYCKMIFDTEGRPVDFIYMEVNKNFEKLTGLKNVIGKKVTEVIPGIRTSNPELFKIYGEVSSSGKAQRFETFVGPLSRWFLVSVYGPKKSFFVAIFQNITEQKQTEKDLEKFKLAVDNTSDHIIITDSEGIVLYGNKAMEETTGYSVAEALGKKAGVLWSTPMPHEYYARMWRTIKQEKKTFRSEIQNKRKNGESYIAQIGISPVLNDVGDILYFVGIERDISKEKEIDKAKTEFVSLASHQLRTPLSAISWYTEMLLAGDAGRITPKQKKYLSEVYAGNQHMVALVNAFLNVSRLDMGTLIFEPEPTDVVTLTKSVLEETSVLAVEKGLSIHETYKEIPEHFSADPKLLRSVVQNIVSNAVKYTPPRGTVSVQWSVVRKGAQCGGTKMHKDMLVFSVADSGIGIPKKQQNKVFTKLFRADNAAALETEGTGLGLYIVKSIVDRSGGKTWLTSVEKKGSTFYVAFPFDGMRKETSTTV